MRCHRNPHPRGTVALRTVAGSGGQGPCEGLDISLLEVVVLALITWEEVGFVTRVHLLLTEYAVLLTPLKVVEEVQQGLWDIEGE